MKHLLLTTIAAVLLVGCGESAPDISIHKAAETGNIEAVKQHLAAGTDVNADAGSLVTPLHVASVFGNKGISELLIANGADVNAMMEDGRTPLDLAIELKKTQTADLLRKHGGKTGKELKAEGK
jgi:ankyrin repeat protein